MAVLWRMILPLDSCASGKEAGTRVPKQSLHHKSTEEFSWASRFSHRQTLKHLPLFYIITLLPCVALLATQPRNLRWDFEKFTIPWKTAYYQDTLAYMLPLRICYVKKDFGKKLVRDKWWSVCVHAYSCTSGRLDALISFYRCVF